MVQGIFKIALRLRYGKFLCDNQWKFQTLLIFNFETNFPENEATKIENTLFLFKTALPEANVKTNRVATIKWTYHKGLGFASKYLIFLEKLFQF